MFSTKEMLLRRTGKNKVGRFDFLKLLVDEFRETKSEEAKQQVLANLANFSYDPINYEFIRKLHIIDLFLDELHNSNENIVDFALAGLCNLCLDPENKEYILSKRGVSAVANCLFYSNVEILTNAIATLTFLITPSSKSEVTCPEIVECVATLQRHPDPRVKNVATLYLDTCCTKQQAKEARHKVDSKLGKQETTGNELGAADFSQGEVK